MMCICPTLFGGKGGKPIISKSQPSLATHQTGMKSSAKHLSPSTSRSDEEITHVTSHQSAGMVADHGGFKDYHPATTCAHVWGHGGGGGQECQEWVFLALSLRASQAVMLNLARRAANSYGSTANSTLRI